MHPVARSPWARLGVAGALALVVGALAVTPAAACDGGVDGSFEQADLVVTGTVVEVVDPAFLFFSAPTDVLRWTLEVDGIEKGAASRRFVVASVRDPACGAAFVIGRRYRVFASLAANGRASVTAADAVALEPLPPPSTEPATPAEPTSPFAVVVWVGGLALAGAAGTRWLIRRLAPPPTGPTAGQLARRERARERAQAIFARAAEAISRAQQARRGVEGAAHAADTADAADAEPALAVDPPRPSRASARSKRTSGARGGTRATKPKSRAAKPAAAKRVAAKSRAAKPPAKTAAAKRPATSKATPRSRPKAAAATAPKAAAKPTSRARPASPPETAAPKAARPKATGKPAVSRKRRAD